MFLYLMANTRLWHMPHAVLHSQKSSALLQAETMAAPHSSSRPLLNVHIPEQEPAPVPQQVHTFQ